MGNLLAQEGQGFIWVPGKLNVKMRDREKSRIPSCTNTMYVLLLFIYFVFI